MKLSNTVQKIKVVSTHLLTVLILLQTGLTAIVASGQLDMFPEALQIVMVILTAVGIAITVIRQVTPVPKDQRGLLPPDPRR